MNPGDTVIITNQRSAYYGQKGTLVEQGNKGGWYIRFGDGNTVYIPFGWKIQEQKEM